MPERFGPEDLTVVIPTRERWDILERTLDALSRQTVMGFESMVVVDGTDQRPPSLRADSVLVKVHGGPGAARNFAVERSRRPLVLLLGDDMLPVPQLVERHLALHNREPHIDVAVLGHVAWHPELPRTRLLRWLDWSDTQFDWNINSEDAGYEHFYSCNVSLKRQLFVEAGGFDEDFVYYYEDLDFGWRLGQKGMRLLYEPAALAQHLHAYEWSGVVRRFEGVARGERLMSSKHAWFSPFFLHRAQQAEASGDVSRFWPMVVDAVPQSAGGLRSAAERRANTWYWRRLAPSFLEAWAGAEPG